MCKTSGVSQIGGVLIWKQKEPTKEEVEYWREILMKVQEQKERIKERKN